MFHQSSPDQMPAEGAAQPESPRGYSPRRALTALTLAACGLGLFVSLPFVAQAAVEVKKPADATQTAESADLKISVTPAQTVVSDDQISSVYFAIKIEGTSEAPSAERLPLNTVFVLDKSGSMNNEGKWDYVVDAIGQAIDAMGTDDYFSLVAYDNGVHTIISPTRNIEAEWAKGKLADLRPGGSTNLHGGLVQGVGHLSEHIKNEFVNRVVLLSDGLANVGPQSTEELRQYAESVTINGTQISTIGVGADYNEDLMLGVAKESGGSYYFIKAPEDIPGIFEEELTGLLTTVAKDIQVTVRLPRGVKYIDSLDRGEDITVEGADGGTLLTFTLPQLAVRQVRNALIHLDVSGADRGDLGEVIEVEASYKSVASDLEAKTLTVANGVAYSDNPEVAEESIIPEVQVRVVELTGVRNRAKALELYKVGDKAAGRQIMTENAAFFSRNAASPAFQDARSQATIRENLMMNNDEMEAYEEGDATASKAQSFKLYEQTK